jgi:hypothetical protein
MPEGQIPRRVAQQAMERARLHQHDGFVHRLADRQGGQLRAQGFAHPLGGPPRRRGQGDPMRGQAHT